MRNHFLLCAFVLMSACIPIVIPVGTPGPTAPLQRLAATAPADAGFDAALARIRRDAGLAPLMSNSGLDRVAASHAAAMVAGGYLAHRDAQGRMATQRVRVAGVSQCGAGENLAQGQTTSTQVLSGWMSSPDHRANLLNGQFVNYGFGRAGNTWVMVLLLPC